MSVAHDPIHGNPAPANDVHCIFSEAHINYLTERAADPQWVARPAGLRTVTADEGARLLGFGRALESTGLAIPYPNIPDYYRVRVDADGVYLVPAGHEVPIYIPPGCRCEGDEPLVVVEGPVKALALQDHGFNAIGLGGVSTTLTREGALNSSWQPLGLVKRRIVIVFDAGRANNILVARAEARLVVALEKAGAKVTVAPLPLRDDGGDQGPDDFLAAHGCDERPLRAIIAAGVPGDPVERANMVTSNADALELLEDLPFLCSITQRGVLVQERVTLALRAHDVKETLLRRAIKEMVAKALPTGARARNSRYEIHEGVHSRVVCIQGLEVAEPLCNFAAHIVEDRKLDDGSGQTTRSFVLEGVLYDGTPLPRVSVPPRELNSEQWVTEHWGCKAAVGADVPRPGHHLLNAIKVVSEAVQTIAFAHTGFRKVEDDWIFLHGGGAVGGTDVLVDLGGPLGRLALPEAVDDLPEAAKTSLEFIGVADERITLPLHAAAYRAPLNEMLRCDAALSVNGDTGTLKSTLAALLQSHFGTFEHNSLPLSWESTANALETALFRTKDMLVTIDDFVPKADRFDEIHKKAERVFRSIGNGSARGRLRADLGAQPDRPCRALVVSTGEDLPRGESVQARLIAIHVKKGDVYFAQLTSLQQGQDRLRHAMLGYVEWLLPRMEDLKTEVPKKYREYRDQMKMAGHLRAPSAIAHLLVGAFYFSQFAVEVGVMTPAEATAHIDATRAALLANADDQVRATHQSNPARRFMEVLSTLFVRGKVALKKVGEKLAPFEKTTGVPEIGWKDDTHAHLITVTTLAVVNKELEEMNESQPLRAYSLWSSMAALGFIEPDGKDLTPKFNGDKSGARPRTLRVPLHILQAPPDPTDPPDDDPLYEPDGDDDDVGEPDPLSTLPEPNSHDVGATEGATTPASTVETASTTVSAQMPRSRPDLSGLLGGRAAAPKMTQYPAVTAERGPSREVSAQMPRSLEGRHVGEERISSPSGSPGGQEIAKNILCSRRVSPPDIWASGHLGGAAGPLEQAAAALQGADRVGLALGVNPKDGLALLAMATPDGKTQSVCLLKGDSLGVLGDVLGKVLLVGHELKPVVAFLQKHGVTPTGVFDTKLAWELYDGHRHDDDAFFTLKNACAVGGVAAVQPERWVRDRLRTEAEQVLLFESDLRARLQEDGLEEAADLEFALLPIITEMETTGVPIDADRWRAVTNKWTKEAASLSRKLTKELGVTNLNDDKQVLAALRRLGFDVDKTNAEALAPYADNPVVTMLGRYRSLVGFVRSAGKGVLDALHRSPDGRVHTTIHQLGARTGRMSCSEPNLMGLPKDPEIRSCIIAPPGKRLIVGDYKAIELRVIADQTGDRALREVFAKPDGCPHRHTASILGEIAEDSVTPEQKNKAKPVNFGIGFGMGSKKLASYARKNFKVIMTDDEADKFRNKFLSHYSGIRAWQERIAQEMAMEFRTRSGRRTFYPYSDEGYNARLSYPIQGSAADGIKAAIVLLHPRLKELGARIVMVVHDELLVEAPEEHAEAVKVIMKEGMITGMKLFVASVPIAVEPETRSNWAE